MVQVLTNTEWLLQGFRYELESTVRPQTVEYYCGEVRRFLQWAKTASVPADNCLSNTSLAQLRWSRGY